MSQETTIKKTTQELFGQLGFSKLKIKVVKEDDLIYKINLQIDPEESGILIGYHGETISSLQLVLSLLVNHQLEEWSQIILGVNDYREKRRQSLEEMAQNSAIRAQETNSEVTLPPMSSFDRRIIHLALQDNPEVSTNSTGEGRDRRIIISPTPKK